METAKVIIKMEDGKPWIVFLHKNLEVIETLIQELNKICQVQTTRISHIIRCADGWYYCIIPGYLNDLALSAVGPFYSFCETIEAEVASVENNIDRFNIRELVKSAR